MKKVFVIVLMLLMSVAVWANDVITVKGRGTGMNEAAALSDAYRDAVETAVGLFVDAEQMMKNDTLIKDEILTQSNGYVVGYDMLSKKERGGLVEVKILAKVKKQEIIKSSSCMMEAKTFQVGDVLKNAHALAESVEARGTAGAELIRKRLTVLSLEKSLCDLALASPDCAIEQSRNTRRNSDLIRIAYALKLSVNEGRYFDDVMPKIRQVLSQVSLSKPKTSSISVKRKLFGVHAFCDVQDIDSFVANTKSKAFGSQPQLRENLEMESASFECTRTASWGGRVSDKGAGVSARVILVTGVNKLRTVYTVEIYDLDFLCAQEFERWTDSINREDSRRKVRFGLKFLDEEDSVLAESPVAPYFSNRCLKSGITKFNDGLPSFIIAPFLLGTRDSQAWECEWYRFEIARDAMPLVRSIRIEAVE